MKSRKPLKQVRPGAYRRYDLVVANSRDVPILNQIVPTGFLIGGSYAVLCDPDSIWYDVSLDITARAVKNGQRTEYHSFQHTPQDVKRGLLRLGVEPRTLEDSSIFRLLDTCTLLTGLPLQPEPLPPTHTVPQIAYKFNDPKNLDVWTEALAKMIKEGSPESERKWLHVDDNTSVFNRYFKEKDLINVFESRFLPAIRISERLVLHSFLTQVASETFYRQFLSHCDGILDLKCLEEGGQMEHYLRVRTIRGTSCDSRRRRVHPGQWTDRRGSRSCENKGARNRSVVEGS